MTIPPAPPAELAVRHPARHVAVVAVAGEITASSEATLMEAYARAATDGVRAVLLDFTHLDYMNSTGIGLLVTLLVRAGRHHVQLLACGLSDHYRQIMELTRLDEAIAVHDTEASALAAFTPNAR